MTSTASSLDRALQLATSRSWYTIPVHPLGKNPAARDYYAAPSLEHDAIRELWRNAGGFIRSTARRVADGRVQGLDTDFVEVVKETDGYADLEPNIAVLLGHSRLVIVDVDTEVQMDAWMALCEREGYDPGPCTQRSPGVIKRSGEVKHDGMGHFFFSLPADLAEHPDLNAGGIKLDVGEPSIDCLTEEERSAAVPDLMTGKRYVLISPSTRSEGAYTLTPGARIRPLPEFLDKPLREHLEGKRRVREQHAERVSHAVRDDAVWEWDETVDWTDLLEDWEETGTEGNCIVLAHPGSSTDRSAVAHTVDCEHATIAKLIGQGTPPPITFYTSTLPDWVAEALDTTTGGSTVGKLKLLAFRDFGGNITNARRSLGLPTRTPTRAAGSTKSAPKLAGWTAVSLAPATVITDLGITLRPPRVRAGTPDIPREVIEDAPEPVVITPAPVAVSAVATLPKAPAKKAPAKRAPAKKPAVKKAPAKKPSPAAAPESYDPAWDAEFTDSVPEIQPWEPVSLHDRAARFIAAHAAPTTPEIWKSIAAREVRLSEWAGKDSESEKWTDRDRERRQTRADLFAIRHLSIADLAEHLGVNPERARALARVLIPTAAQAGFVIRDRPRGDPLRYMVPPSKPEDSDLAIWKVQ